MTDEFSAGIRRRKQIQANKSRSAVRGVDGKPEAFVRSRTGDQKLDSEINKLQRSVETIQGTRGRVGDHAITRNQLDELLKGYTNEVRNGYIGTRTNAINTETALSDAAVAQATADQALSDANEAHTGEVTSPAGSRVLTVDVTAVSNRTEVLAESGDHVIIRDASDGGIKKVDVDSIVDGGFF